MTKYYLSIGVLFKNESLILKEWLDHHIFHGVDHFYLINDNSNDCGGILGYGSAQNTFTNCSVEITYSGSGNVTINNNSNRSGGIMGSGDKENTYKENIFTNCSITITSNGNVTINNNSYSCGGIMGIYGVIIYLDISSNIFINCSIILVIVSE